MTGERNMHRRFLLCQFVSLSACLVLALGSLGAWAEEALKTAYHLTGGQQQSTVSLYNIMAHMKADPQARIVAVINHDSVKDFVTGGQDARGKAMTNWVTELSAQGVQFRICNNSLDVRQIARDTVLPGIAVVPSGVAELARLQGREGFGYIRP